LLDVRMPIMDGIETATAIRRWAKSEMTPIIADHFHHLMREGRGHKRGQLRRGRSRFHLWLRATR
jgi:hypothetical protein